MMVMSFHKYDGDGIVPGNNPGIIKITGHPHLALSIPLFQETVGKGEKDPLCLPLLFHIALITFYQKVLSIHTARSGGYEKE